MYIFTIDFFLKKIQLVHIFSSIPRLSVPLWPRPQERSNSVCGGCWSSWRRTGTYWCGSSLPRLEPWNSSWLLVYIQVAGVLSLERSSIGGGHNHVAKSFPLDSFKVHYMCSSKTSHTKSGGNRPVNSLAGLDSWLCDIRCLLNDTCPVFMVWPAAVTGGCRAHDLLEGEVWERRPRAVVRQRAAFFFDSDLEVRLIGSHKGSHARKWVRGVPCPQVAIVLFAANVFFLPLKLAL